MTDSEEKYTAVSVKPETRKGLQIMKAQKGISSYDELIRSEIEIEDLEI